MRLVPDFAQIHPIIARKLPLQATGTRKPIFYLILHKNIENLEVCFKDALYVFFSILKFSVKVARSGFSEIAI